LADLKGAVALTAGRARLEASGGITLERIRAVAETGVDEISVGDLTKDLVAVDLSMRFVNS
jgi:nicotinate-nucleotide pyrophosphorylase (carboxylating)